MNRFWDLFRFGDGTFLYCQCCPAVRFSSGGMKACTAVLEQDYRVPRGTVEEVKCRNTAGAVLFSSA